MQTGRQENPFIKMTKTIVPIFLLVLEPGIQKIVTNVCILSAKKVRTCPIKEYQCWFSLAVESELESESEKSERFHFFRFPLRLRRLSESNAEVEDQTNYKARNGAQ